MSRSSTTTSRRRFLKAGLLWLPATAMAAPLLGGRRIASPKPPTSSGVTYLVEENCEGTGTPAGWTDSGTVNWDDTTAPVLQGSQQLSLDGTSLTSYSRTDFANQTELWVYFLVRWSALSSSTGKRIVLIRPNGGGSDQCTLDLNGGPGIIRVFNGTVSQEAVTTVSTATKYHFWVHWKNDGVASVGFSTTGTRPTTGNNFASVTGGDGTGNGGRLFVMEEGGNAAVFDRILVLQGSTPIGDNP